MKAHMMTKIRWALLVRFGVTGLCRGSLPRKAIENNGRGRTRNRTRRHQRWSLWCNAWCVMRVAWSSCARKRLTQRVCAPLDRVTHHLFRRAGNVANVREKDEDKKSRSGRSRSSRHVSRRLAGIRLRTARLFYYSCRDNRHRRPRKMKPAIFPSLILLLFVCVIIGA
jgi:hypothetical protein